MATKKYVSEKIQIGVSDYLGATIISGILWLVPYKKVADIKGIREIHEGLSHWDEILSLDNFRTFLGPPMQRIYVFQRKLDFLEMGQTNAVLLYSKILNTAFDLNILSTIIFVLLLSILILS